MTVSAIPSEDSGSGRSDRIPATLPHSGPSAPFPREGLPCRQQDGVATREDPRFGGMGTVGVPTDAVKKAPRSRMGQFLVLYTAAGRTRIVIEDGRCRRVGDPARIVRGWNPPPPWRSGANPAPGDGCLSSVCLRSLIAARLEPEPRVSGGWRLATDSCKSHAGVRPLSPRVGADDQDDLEITIDGSARGWCD